MLLTFYGVRGGYPGSGPGFTAVGAHTTCIRVDLGQRTVIIDAGTGLARLGRELLGEGRAASELILLLTHGHHDHLAGLPYFRPAYRPGAVIRVFGPPAMGTARAVQRMFEPPWFPVRFDELPATWHLRDLAEREELRLEGAGGPPVVEALGTTAPAGLGPGDALVRALRCYGHLRDGVYAYRIDQGGRSLVVATDVEAPVGGDVRLAEFARGADLLVHDAQYSTKEYLGIPTQGFGHSTPEMACELARQAGVGRLLLTHHAPERDDEEVARLEAQARVCFANTEAAREGTRVELRPKKKPRRG